MDKVVILAGGKGARLRPFSFVIPKPLMPIGEDPILMHLIKSFQKHAINSFLISIFILTLIKYTYCQLSSDFEFQFWLEPGISHEMAL